MAILWRDGRILARLRRADEHLPGLWEFPGGKIASAESPVEAARREVHEELGVSAERLALREIVEHAYADRPVRLHVFEGECMGDPASTDGAGWAWLTPAQLASLPVPDANRDLVARLAAAERARAR